MPLQLLIARISCAVFLLLTSIFSFAQDDQRLIIITTDGFRWQEVYNGMDAAIASDKRFNQYDSAGIFNTYWDQSPEARRQKLLPFFWVPSPNRDNFMAIVNLVIRLIMPILIGFHIRATVKY